jgi:hypothetical protein
MKSSITINDPWGDAWTFADQDDVAVNPVFSNLLGPNGKPLKYKQPDPIGFRLKPSTKES